MSSGVSHAKTDGRTKPIVRHRVQTITIHRDAKDPSTAGVQVVHLGSPSTGSPREMSASTGSSNEDVSDDGGYEANDHDGTSFQAESAGDD
jgi:hypothetical protein